MSDANPAPEDDETPRPDQSRYEDIDKTDGQVPVEDGEDGDQPQ